MNPEIDPENLAPFQNPDEFLEQLFEFTGNAEDQSKGFTLCYSDQNGTPMVLSKAGTQIVEMGLRKALEKYLIQMEEVDISIEGSQGSE
jgi:hypothetical protein